MTNSMQHRGSSGHQFSDVGQVDFRLVRAAHKVRFILLSLGIAVCIIALSGHVLGREELYRPVAGEGGTHPLTILCGALLAGALLIYSPMRPPNLVKTVLLLVALGLASMQIAEHLFFGGSGLLSAIVPQAADANAVRMGMNTALTVVLLSLGRLLSRRLPGAAFAVGTSALFLTVVSLLGYVYGITELHGAMSPMTAIMFLALGAAGICTFAHHRVLRCLVRADLPGRLARRQILAATAFFMACGFVMSCVPAFGEWTYLPILTTLAIWYVGGMVILASQAQEAADKERRRQERLMARYSVSDPLTGLANRRAAQHTGRAIFEQSRRTGDALSAMLIDIDHFKRVNDSYGHAAGDALLRSVAAVLENRLRSSDVIARWGGEEFLVLLAGTGETAGRTVAEEIRTLIAAQTVAAEGHKAISVTVSIGLAARALSDGSLDALIARADEALYAAKDGGRDRVVSCSDCFALRQTKAAGGPCGCGHGGIDDMNDSPCGSCPLSDLDDAQLSGAS